LNSIVAGDTLCAIGDRWPDKLATHRRTCAQWRGKARRRSSAARRRKPPRKHNATAQAVEGNLGGFCVRPHTAATPCRLLAYRFVGDTMLRIGENLPDVIRDFGSIVQIRSSGRIELPLLAEGGSIDLFAPLRRHAKPPIGAQSLVRAAA